MNFIEKQLYQAVNTLALPSDKFTKCNPATARNVVERVEETFVLDRKQFWWMSLKHPFESFDYSDGFGFEDLMRHVPRGDTRCWFIPESEEEHPLVFDAEVTSITAILAECSYFEYYLVGKRFDWLIVENDHNQVIVSRIAPWTNPA
ncbi:MAG TPA: DUF6756 family protein [Pyrinomonadaceae bacterium]|jgi:hypothetical protein|nr:DUF6756 family protein [Pyrinomonadaceae bacterium]